MILKLKALIKFTIYYIINFLIKPSKEIMPKSLLLIRLDVIGDYVIFRNFIEELKKSEKYNEYKLTLLGNSAWKSLSEELDSKYVDEFIWLDRKRFTKDLKYRYTKLKEIVSKGYEVILSPVYGREFFYGDTIVKLVNAKEKIGSNGNLSNIQKWQKNISDDYYTELIPAKYELLFEFNRNREFFENLLKKKIDIKKPTIRLDQKKLDFDLSEKYVVLFIGASTSFRKWNIKGFAKVGQYLKDNYGYDIVLCGAPSDKEDSNEFKEYFNDEYIDLVGRTSLRDLLYVIANGNLMISNETSAPHFAVALEMTNIFVIFNGNHYGRFTPYPEEISDNYHVVYHPQIKKDLDDYKTLSNSYGFDSDLDINEISVEQVISKINKVFIG